jgi:hypothetical protein
MRVVARCNTSVVKKQPMISRFIDGLPSIGVYQLLREGTVRPSDTVVRLKVDGVAHTLVLKRGLCGVLFCCPRCNSARWHLYPDAGSLACRACLRLIYPQHLAYRIRRLRRQLGASEVPLSPLPLRKGLRGWKALRYDRLTAMIKAFEARAVTALDRSIDQGMKVRDRQQRQHKRDAVRERGPA